MYGDSHTETKTTVWVIGGFDDMLIALYNFIQTDDGQIVRRRIRLRRF